MIRGNLAFVDELAEPLTVKLSDNHYSVTDHVLGSPMQAPQYNRAACLFSGLILLSQLPLLAIAGELSQSEHAVASNLAAATPWPTSDATPRATIAKQSAVHPLGLQTLSIEADWKKHADGARLARIYQYDYTQLKSRLLVIDVNSEQVLREQLIGSVHLPLSDDEINYAATLINSDATLLLHINQERALRSLEPINTLESFDVKASIYEPTMNDHLCSEQRCVLFALVDTTLTVSSVEPLVLLNHGEVRLLQSTLRE